MAKKYDLDEIQKLLKRGEEYAELERQGRLIKLPCPLETMVYQVVQDCDRCNKDKDSCKTKLRNDCVKKVMPCLFTADLIPQFGKTVFSTETEATVHAVS